MIKKIIKKILNRAGYDIVGFQPKNFNSIIVLKGENNTVNVPQDKNIHVEIEGNNNRMDIDDSIRVGHEGKLKIKIKGDGHRLIIGKDIIVRRGLNIKMMLAGPSSLGCHNCTVEIGDNTHFNGKEIQLYTGEGNTKIAIGKGTLWADNITVCTSDYHAILDAVTGERINAAADISIGDHVWIGMNTIIFKGSVIPKFSVVAANAVVTKAFDEENIIIAGVPARIAKQGVTWKDRLD